MVRFLLLYRGHRVAPDLPSVCEVPEGHRFASHRFAAVHLGSIQLPRIRLGDGLLHARRDQHLVPDSTTLFQ